MRHTVPRDGATATKGTTLPAIDRDAFPAATVGLLPAAVAGVSGHRRTALGLLALPLGLVAFFRDPDRTPDVEGSTPLRTDVLLAPADGKVMHAGPAQDGVAPAGRETWQQVSIFLSLFDVHINRTPAAGRVTEISYRPGRWSAAYRFESATENERSEITIVDDQRTVVFRQVVGLVARRVVTRVRVGDRLRAGQRIGLMRFGSRMDVFVPPDVVLTVRAGDRTVAGETVIGRWPS